MSFRGEFFVYHGVDAVTPITKLNLALDNGYDLFQNYVTDNELTLEDPVTHFRFIDVVYDSESSAPALWVSHHQWHDEKDCYSLRLSKLSLDAARSLEEQTATSGDWQKIYDTSPCLPLNSTIGKFAGHQSGGRIVVTGPDAVLLSVGDHSFDGWNIPGMQPQDASSDYGKIILVQPSTGTASLVSTGHRNPQGLMVDADGHIWSTEHGPFGGDELNLIDYGGNYGWPYVSYGAQYGMSRWPLSEDQNRHAGFVRPVLSWIPSIGVSNIIQVEGFLPVWNGDLLVSSLIGKTLHRIRYRDGRVIFDEPIEIGKRIRDLDQLDNGTIVLWTNDSAILELKLVESVQPDINAIVASLPEPKRHQALSIIGACLQCHGASPHPKPGGAFNLWEVVGRDIAATDFDGYSDGLKAKSGNWDSATLDAFLMDVRGFSKGSNMFFSGISDDSIRSTVIDYLEALAPEHPGDGNGAPAE